MMDRPKICNRNSVIPLKYLLLKNAIMVFRCLIIRLLHILTPLSQSIKIYIREQNAWRKCTRIQVSLKEQLAFANIATITYFSRYLSRFTWMNCAMYLLR